jgi:hypothetical protein
MLYRSINKASRRKPIILVAYFLFSITSLAQVTPKIIVPCILYKPSAARVGVLDGLQTIENDKIQVGIDTRYGGAITRLRFLNNQNGNVSTDNMVNNPDLGRQIQVGLYGGPIDYSKNGAPGWTGLGWNPIQAGDTYRNPSEVVAIDKQDNLLYVKTIPKQFALNNEPGEATIEQWIRLSGNVVKVHVKTVLFRTDKTQYAARQQEMPCMYLNGDYHNMWYYNGGDPFTNGSLAMSRQQPPATFLFGDVYPTEPWMATTNDNGYGVGLYYQNNYDWKRGYFGSDLVGGEFSEVASYVAATPFVLLDNNIVYEWDYELVVGHLNEIRSYIYSQPRPSAGPNYRFDASRKGWYYYGTKDSGWPIQGKLHIQVDESQPNDIKSPFVFWKGRANPKIYLRAAFNTVSSKFRLSWRRAEDETLYRTGDRYTDFPIINDGQFHTYEIDLSSNDNWLNYNIGQIEFSTIPGGPSNNGWAEFEWVAARAAGPTDDPIVTPPIDPGNPVVVVPCTPGCLTISAERIR